MTRQEFEAIKAYVEAKSRYEANRVIATLQDIDEPDSDEVRKAEEALEVLCSD